MDGGASASSAVAYSDNFYAPANAAYNSAAGVSAPSSNGSSALAASGFGVQAVSGLGAAFAQSRAASSLGHYQTNQYDFNAQIADLQAQDATDRGDIAAQKEQKTVASTVGTERANLAGEGVQVDSGSAAEIQENTKEIGAQNVITIKNNAWREAWGYKTQALGAEASGQFAGLSASNISENTLLTGGINAVGDIGKGMGAYQGYYRGSGGNANPGVRT